MKKIDRKNNFSPNEKTFIDFDLPYRDGEIGAQSSFLQEVAYQNTIDDDFSLPLYNKIYGNTLYGKIDKKGFSIAPQGIYINRMEDIDTDQNTFNFVADAYRDFLKKWNGLVNKEVVSDSFFNVTIKRGYENIETVYENYLQEHYNKFVLYIKNNKLENHIIEFDSFLKLFFDYIYLQSRTNPFSLSKFIKSKRCPDTITGLVLYLDNKKITYNNKKEYIENKDFFLLNETLNSCGFIVHKNEPWKITFNIYSPLSKKYINKYGDSNKIYDSFFLKINSYDLFYFQKIMFNFYNNFVNENKNLITFNYKNCNNKLISKKEVKERISLSQEEISSRLNSQVSYKWWKLYISTRILEEGKAVDQFKVDSLANEIYRTYQKLDMEPALRYLERSLAAMPPEIANRKKLSL